MIMLEKKSYPYQVDMTFTACTPSNGLGSVISIPKLGVDDLLCGRVQEGPGRQVPEGF